MINIGQKVVFKANTFIFEFSFKDLIHESPYALGDLRLLEPVLISKKTWR